MKPIVMKFGGTSVADAARVHEVAAIVAAQPLPRAAVVSAAAGVTNLLLDAARAAAVAAGMPATLPPHAPRGLPPKRVLIMTGDDQTRYTRNEWDLATGRRRILHPGETGRWLASEPMP